MRWLRHKSAWSITTQATTAPTSKMMAFSMRLPCAPIGPKNKAPNQREFTLVQRPVHPPE